MEIRRKEFKMTMAQQTVVAKCPDCGYEIDLGPDPEIGEAITCPECWAYLIITSLEPPQLNWDTYETEDDDSEIEEDW
jgi:lysine biosynthesis protein LysW